MAIRQWTQLSIDEISPENYEHWIKLAEDGSVRAAQLLMAEASTFLQHDMKIPEPLRSYIGEALYRAALGAYKFGQKNGGVEVAEAFNLKHTPGRNKYEEILKKHLICLEVEAARRYVAKKVDAPNVVADMYSDIYSDPGSVARIWKSRKREWAVEKHSNSELDRFINQYRYLCDQHPSRPLKEVLLSYPCA